MEEYKLNRLIETYLKESSKYTLNDMLLIVSKTLNLDKVYLYANVNNIILKKTEHDILKANFEKLIHEDIPLQYILGSTQFYKEQYIVNENVLIPRADTEILVEKVIELINKNNLKTLIDMCSGSGCVGISTLKNSNLKSALLVDVSDKALEVSKENIKLNDVKESCKTCKSDLFSNIDTSLKFDILVSNPPYINSDIIDTLEPEVKKEPPLALDGGKDGMNFYKRILKELRGFLNDKAYIVFEIGYDQKEKLVSLSKQFKYIEYIETVKDLSNNDRVVVCRFHQI